MRSLFLLRGAPASGKSTWIKDFVYLICDFNGLMNYEDVENMKSCKNYESANDGQND